MREREILRQRTRIGFVFQKLNLFPHLTVLDNLVEAPVSALKRPRKDAVEAARALLDRVGLADKADSYPKQLSGGQQQRVAIARALAWDRSCCSSTSRPRRSTPSWSAKSSTSSRTWPTKAPR